MRRLRRIVRACSIFLCLAKLCLPRLLISATRLPNVIGEPSVVIVVLWGAHGTVVPPISDVPPPSGLLKRMAVLAGWMLNPSSANSASRCLSSSWRWLRSWLHRVPPSRLAVVVGSRRWRLEGPVL